jgi:hypothetical protein
LKRLGFLENLIQKLNQVKDEKNEELIEETKKKLKL